MNADPRFFQFRPTDRPLVVELLRVMRLLLTRADLSPREVGSIALVMHALSELPAAPKDVSLGVILKLQDDDGHAWMGFHIRPDRFELDGGQSVRSDYGTDNESASVFHVEEDFRSVESTLKNAAGWLDAFRIFAAHPQSQLDIENLDDEPTVLSDTCDSDWWSELPLPEDDEDDDA